MMDLPIISQKYLYHKLYDLEQQKFLASQVWKLKVQRQGIFRTMCPLKPVREDPSSTFPVSAALNAPWLVPIVFSLHLILHSSVCVVNVLKSTPL